MALSALLLTADRVTRDQFTAVLEKAAISVQHVSTSGEAMQRLTENQFHTVVIDCDVEAALLVIETFRRGELNRSSVTFALVPERQMMKPAYVAGANFVFQKPLTSEAVARAMRAAHGLLFGSDSTEPTKARSVVAT